MVSAGPYRPGCDGEGGGISRDRKGPFAAASDVCWILSRGRAAELAFRMQGGGLLCLLPSQLQHTVRSASILDLLNTGRREIEQTSTGGTSLFVKVSYNPASIPSDPTCSPRLPRPSPSTAPCSYVPGRPSAHTVCVCTGCLLCSPSQATPYPTPVPPSPIQSNPPHPSKSSPIFSHSI